MPRKRYFSVVKPDGSVACGGELMDGSLIDAAEEVAGAIIDPEGKVVYVARSLYDPDESAEPADPDDLALPDSTPEAAESDEEGEDG